MLVRESMDPMIKQITDQSKNIAIGIFKALAMYGEDYTSGMK